MDGAPTEEYRTMQRYWIEEYMSTTGRWIPVAQCRDERTALTMAASRCGIFNSGTRVVRETEGAPDTLVREFPERHVDQLQLEV